MESERCLQGYSRPEPVGPCLKCCLYLLAGLPELRIIHGKGTGALRAGLTAYLSAHRAVKRLELASLHEGGAGATVIYL